MATIPLLARTSAVDPTIGTLLEDVGVVCFDEFHRRDSGDARVLARVLNVIVDNAILLVTTSNYPPEELLANEYHHHLVRPTIAAIRQHMEVHELDARRDYRTITVSDADRRGYNRESSWPHLGQGNFSRSA